MRCIHCLNILLAALVVGSVTVAGSTSTGAVFDYVSPVPGARYVRAQTTLILRPSAALTGAWTSACTVRGLRSGLHDGSWVRSGGAYIFEPRRPFLAGEKVTVSVARAGGATSTCHDGFSDG